MEFLLGLDGGGTGSRARLAQVRGSATQAPVLEELGSAEAGPCNATTDLAGALGSAAELWSHLASSCGLDPLADAGRVSFVAGCAGIEEPDVRAAFLSGLPAFGRRLVTSDGVTAVYGAADGAACSLLQTGTGLIGARLDPTGSARLVSGWGWWAGDAGSGAWLGLMALRAYLRGFDRGRPRLSPMSRGLAEHIGDDRVSILRWLRSSTARLLARLAPELFEWAAQGDAEAQAILERGADSLCSLVAALEPAGDPLFLAGGLGASWRPLLQARLGAELQSPRGGPLEGALLLAAADPAPPLP